MAPGLCRLQRALLRHRSALRRCGIPASGALLSNERLAHRCPAHWLWQPRTWQTATWAALGAVGHHRRCSRRVQEVASAHSYPQTGARAAYTPGADKPPPDDRSPCCLHRPTWICTATARRPIRNARSLSSALLQGLRSRLTKARDGLKATVRRKVAADRSHRSLHSRHALALGLTVSILCPASATCTHTVHLPEHDHPLLALQFTAPVPAQEPAGNLLELHLSAGVCYRRRSRRMRDCPGLHGPGRGVSGYQQRNAAGRNPQRCHGEQLEADAPKVWQSVVPLPATSHLCHTIPKCSVIPNCWFTRRLRCSCLVPATHSPALKLAFLLLQACEAVTMPANYSAPMTEAEQTCTNSPTCSYNTGAEHRPPQGIDRLLSLTLQRSSSRA